MGWGVVEKAVARGKVVLSGGWLMGGELADSGEEGKVKCSCIKEQGPYLLNPSLLRGRDWGGKGGDRGGWGVERKVGR